jgi:hypothetical protein
MELLTVRAISAAIASSSSPSGEPELESAAAPACRLTADSVSLQLAVRVHRWLQDEVKDDEAAQAWAEQLRVLFPLAVQLGAASAAADIRLLATNSAAAPADGNANTAAAQPAID